MLVASVVRFDIEAEFVRIADPVVVLTLVSVVRQRRLGVTIQLCLFLCPETVRKRRFVSFYPLKDTFDADPISVATSLKSEPETVECSLEDARRRRET